MLKTRSLVALLLAALVALPSVALAQTQTDTTPLGDYETTTTASTIETEPTITEAPTTATDTTPEPPSTGGGDPTTAGGGGAPTTTETPTALAFTGFEAGIVALVGVLLMGGAVVLQRRRRLS